MLFIVCVWGSRYLRILKCTYISSLRFTFDEILIVLSKFIDVICLAITTGMFACLKGMTAWSAKIILRSTLEFKVELSRFFGRSEERWESVLVSMTLRKPTMRIG